MSARRASFSPRDKAKQRKRVREKGTPTACLFCALRAQSPAAFCLRQNRQDRRSAERRIKFPIKVQLCRTFIPLPAPRRRGLVRRTPGHLLLPFQGNSPCADERGGSFPISPEPETYPGGTASPLEESPQARKKAACIHRRPFPQRVGKKSKERKNNERYKQINGRSGCRTLPHGHGPSAQNLHDNHW